MSTVITNPKSVATLSAAFTSDVTTGTASHSKSATPSVGTPSGSVNFEVVKTINVNTNGATIDFSSIQDVGGNTITPSFLCAYLIESQAAGGSGQTMSIGGGSNAIVPSGGNPVLPLGHAKYDGIAAGGITIDGTHKNLTLTASSGTFNARVSALLR